ncbi:hypothetical protein D3C75_955950 [compost metagenome]
MLGRVAVHQVHRHEILQRDGAGIGAVGNLRETQLQHGAQLLVDLQIHVYLILLGKLLLHTLHNQRQHHFLEHLVGFVIGLRRIREAAAFPFLDHIVEKRGQP